MFKLACVTAREFVDVDCCTALMSPIAFYIDEGTVKGDLPSERILFILRCKPDRVPGSLSSQSVFRYLKKTLPISGQGQQITTLQQCRPRTWSKVQRFTVPMPDQPNGSGCYGVGVIYCVRDLSHGIQDSDFRFRKNSRGLTKNLRS